MVRAAYLAEVSATHWQVATLDAECSGEDNILAPDDTARPHEEGRNERYDDISAEIKSSEAQ